MKAWLLDSLDGLKALRFGDAPDPVPGPDEVVLDVELASLNPADRYLAEGAYPGKPPFPHILGRDCVGTVTAVGPGVVGVRPGDTKAILRGEAGVTRPGTLAEKVAVPTDVLVDLPAGWTREQAAGAPLVYLTAYQAITQWLDLPLPTATKPGPVVLVSGASGGVGLATVQLATAMGYTVAGLSRDVSKHSTIKHNGASFVYTPDDAGDWVKQLFAQLGTRPVALAVDNIGGPLFPRLIDTLAMNGRVSCVGRLGGPVPEFNTSTLFFRRVQIRGVAVGTYSATEAQQAWRAIVTLLEKSRFTPIVDRVFPFEQVLPAFDRLKAGPLGKVLIRVRS